MGTDYFTKAAPAPTGLQRIDIADHDGSNRVKLSPGACPVRTLTFLKNVYSVPANMGISNQVLIRVEFQQHR